jgi:glycosyltransferase involved in cell wall biosynthesis
VARAAQRIDEGLRHHFAAAAARRGEDRREEGDAQALTIGALRIGHITSRYPIPSHAFIAREVRELRRQGVEVHTFSVRAVEDVAGLSGEDRQEAATTTGIRPVSPRHLLGAHARALGTAPGAWLATLRHALALRTPGARGGLWQLFYFAQAILFSGQCRERELAHVHVHHANVAADITLLAAHFGRLAGSLPQSWSITLHGPTEYLEAERYRPGAKAREADLVICISQHSRDQLAALSGPLPEGRVQILKLGVDLTRMPYREPAAHADPLRVLNVAQLVPRKGQAIILEALKQLAGDGVRFRLTLVGAGEDRERLEALARELGIAAHVDFKGALGQDEVLAAYRDADAFCLTSYAEGLPVVLMEAMASGVPVVATRVAGTPELVEDGASGLLVDTDRADQVAAALARLAAEPALRAELARRARARIEDEHDLATLVRQLAELIGRCGAA